MANKKGVKHYSESFKQKVREEYNVVASMMSLHRKYGISVYKHRKTRYNAITELQYVIRQPEFRPKVQNLLLSDDGLIAIGKQIKSNKTLCTMQGVFFVFIFR